eukprot:scaffold2933_cov85-Cylindrotheca_fusiformis.AAC.4
MTTTEGGSDRQVGCSGGQIRTTRPSSNTTQATSMELPTMPPSTMTGRDNNSDNNDGSIGEILDEAIRVCRNNNTCRNSRADEGREDDPPSPRGSSQ